MNEYKFYIWNETKAQYEEAQEVDTSYKLNGMSVYANGILNFFFAR